MDVRDNLEVPFLRMGDFNEVLNVGERSGNSNFTRSMEDFRQWVEDMNLVDLPLIERKFTWKRKLL